MHAHIQVRDVHMGTRCVLCFIDFLCSCCESNAADVNQVAHAAVHHPARAVCVCMYVSVCVCVCVCVCLYVRVYT